MVKACASAEEVGHGPQKKGGEGKEVAAAVVDIVVVTRVIESKVATAADSVLVDLDVLVAVLGPAPDLRLEGLTVGELIVAGGTAIGRGGDIE
jgi:hypothetical protein